MSLPASKKQKVKNDRSPIVFTSPGLNPDVRLKVFDDLEFHVHSAMLKLHSEFFRKFLDSPDKVAAPSKTNFRYKWATMIDADGTWHLITSTGPQVQSSGDRALKGNKDNEERAFEAFLSSLYNRPYKLEDGQQLILMTKLADYYCALPALSRTIDGALYRSPDAFIKGMKDSTCEFLAAAEKLRNPTLFKDCLLLWIGPWRNPKYQYSRGLDGKLKTLAEVLFNHTCVKIVEVHQDIMDEVCKSVPAKKDEFGCQMASIARDCQNVFSKHIAIPKYYRELHNSYLGFRSLQRLSDLLKSDLLLDKLAISGAGSYTDYFLCGKIDDKDLPWDPTETDW